MASLAIDPSLASSGYVVFDKGVVLELGTVPTKADDSQSKRLGIIYRHFKDVISRYDITEIVAEDQFVNRGKDGNMQTALILSRVRGVIMLMADELNLPFIVYSPSEVKQVATGKGNSLKDAVRAAMKRVYNQQLVHTQLAKSHWDDMSDALAIYHCHKLLRAGRAS